MIVKILVGVLGTGLTIGAGAASIIYLGKGTTIEELVKIHDKNKTFLNSSNKGNGSDWAQAWKNYKEDNNKLGKNKGSDTWELEDWNKQHDKEPLPTSFVTACEKKIKDTAKGEKDKKYINFVRWCSK